jgi:translation initiation factor 2B subunit (eIF-2B alpha/beta/delta family)
MSDMDAIRSLMAEIDSGGCSIFVGSGISIAYTDAKGKTYNGMPSAKNLVASLCRTRTYCTQDMSLIKACTIVSLREDRPSLIKFITEHIPAQFSNPLPAHFEIARLPVNAIITTNWDLLTEKALIESERPYHTIVRDSDIPLLKQGCIPIIKFHGTVDQPETIAATYSDIHDLFAKKPVIVSMLRTLFARGCVLFVGYSLDDDDFKYLFHGLQAELSTNMRDHYAVQLNPDTYSVEYWQSNRINVIDSDATGFLSKFNATISIGNNPVMSVSSDFYMKMTDIVFRSLLEAGTFPSASQVLDGALKVTLELLDIDADWPSSEIADKITDAFEMLIEMKPHYQALWQFKEVILPTLFAPRTASKDEAKQILRELISTREADKNKIGKIGAQEIYAGDKILIFAQSTRVQAVINYWLEDHRRDNASIEVIVCECRPKSITPFRDAMAYIGGINESEHLSLKIIPDSAVANLMAHGQINKVFFGAHSVIRESHDVRLINATGALMISRLAALNNVPVYVFTESAKIRQANGVSVPQTAEESIFTDPVVQDFKRTRRIDLFNPGFDEILSSQTPFTLITEGD